VKKTKKDAIKTVNASDNNAYRGTYEVYSETKSDGSNTDSQQMNQYKHKILITFKASLLALNLTLTRPSF
jgi:hypothetical protein